MSSINFDNVCFFHLKGVCAFGSRCHKLHVKPMQHTANHVDDDRDNTSIQLNDSFHRPEPVHSEGLSSDRILELRRGLDNLLFGRAELDSEDAPEISPTTSTPETSCIKSLHENANQICIAFVDGAPSVDQKTTLLPSNSLESSAIKSSTESKKSDNFPVKVAKLSEFSFEPQTYSKGNSVSYEGSDEEKFITRRSIEYLSQSSQNSLSSSGNISSEETINKTRVQPQDDRSHFVTINGKVELYKKDDRKSAIKERKISDKQKSSFDKKLEKFWEVKMRHAFTLLSEQKSDDAIKAFTEIVKDKSAVLYKQEALFGRCKSQILKRNLTLALIDVSKALSDETEDIKYVETHHKDELLIEMASLQLKFGRSEKAREAVSQLSILRPELTHLIDVFEKNLSDIEELLSQSLPPIAHKIIRDGKLKLLADFILTYTKESGLKSLEKVSTCKDIAPECRSLRFLELECIMRTNDKTRAGVILDRLSSMKWTPEEKQTLEVLRLIYKFTFTFDWSSFPSTTGSSPTPMDHLLSDFRKAVQALTGPVPDRWTELQRVGSLANLCFLEKDGLGSLLKKSPSSSFYAFFSGPVPSNAVYRLMGLADDPATTASVRSLPTMEDEDKDDVERQGRARKRSV